MTDEQTRIHDLERTVAELGHTVVRLQQQLLKVSKWEHEDIEKRVEGIQILLGKAGEAKGRPSRGRRPR